MSPAEQPLRSVLAWLGYTAVPTTHASERARAIVRGDAIVFVGDAGEVWQWLEQTWCQRVGWSEAA